MKDQAMRIEEERARLREEAEALRERCDTDEHPSHEEMREFGEKGAAFARETLPPAAAGSGPCVTEQRENGDGHSAVPTRWQVAVHEAAHAVYAHRQGFGVLGVEISGIVAVEGGGESGGRLGRCSSDLDGEQAGVLNGRLGCILSLVGISAAHEAGWPEALLPWDGFVLRAGQRFPEPPPWNADSLERVLMDAGLVRDLSDEEHVLLATHLDEDPEGFYEAARAEAEVFVVEHWAEIVALAEKLVDAESLGASGVSAVLGPGWPEFRELLDEMARENDLAPWMKAAMEAAGTDDPGEIEIGPDGGVIAGE